MNRRFVELAMRPVAGGEIMAWNGVESRLQNVEQSRIGNECVACVVTAGLAGIDRQAHAPDLLADRAAARRRPFVEKIQQIFEGAKIA